MCQSSSDQVDVEPPRDVCGGRRTSVCVTGSLGGTGDSDVPGGPEEEKRCTYVKEEDDPCHDGRDQ